MLYSIQRDRYPASTSNQSGMAQEHLDHISRLWQLTSFISLRFSITALIHGHNTIAVFVRNRYNAQALSNQNKQYLMQIQILSIYHDSLLTAALTGLMQQSLIEPFIASPLVMLAHTHPDLIHRPLRSSQHTILRQIGRQTENVNEERDNQQPPVNIAPNSLFHHQPIEQNQSTSEPEENKNDNEEQHALPH